MDSHRFLVKEDTLLPILEALANERLTQKQKHILVFISNNQVTATSLARRLSRELVCSRSAVWNNLTSLQRAGLVARDKDRRLFLTIPEIIRRKHENKYLRLL